MKSKRRGNKYVASKQTAGQADTLIVICFVRIFEWSNPGVYIWADICRLTMIRHSGLVSIALALGCIFRYLVSNTEHALLRSKWRSDEVL